MYFLLLLFLFYFFLFFYVCHFLFFFFNQTYRIFSCAYKKTLSSRKKSVFTKKQSFKKTLSKTNQKQKCLLLDLKNKISLSTLPLTLLLSLLSAPFVTQLFKNSTPSSLKFAPLLKQPTQRTSSHSLRSSAVLPLGPSACGREPSNTPSLTRKSVNPDSSLLFLTLWRKKVTGS
jgi:hypothetical protein